jgi:cystathionine beta-lyase/cystathionine gamma-synthase
MGAFAAWVLLHGVKTLPMRVERHSAHAAALAALLSAHPAVTAVHYPGLPSHPGHAIAQHLVGDQFGGMLAVELAGGEAAVGPFLNALELPTIAVSLGDVSTLIWPIPGGVLRLSVGLEDLADLEADFANALAHVPSPASVPVWGPAETLS